MSDKKHQVFVIGVDGKPLTPTNWRKAKKLMKNYIVSSILIILYSIIFSTAIYSENKSNLSPMELYKPIYWIFGSSNDQTKLNISFKYSITKQYRTGLFFGYSQLSKWNLYEPSAPFYDNNYNPEIFIKSKYFLNKYIDYIQFAPYEHRSNGKNENDSRSLNRTYLQLQTSYRILISGKVVVHGINLKGFIYYNEDEPYSEYDKHYEAKLFTSLGVGENAKEEIYIKFSGFTKGYFETGFISRKFWFMNPRIYVQMFNGYNEIMLDYNKKETAVRIGITFK